ncbi:glycosyltransferase family 4 protein [Pseudomonas sp. RIT-PI-S]|uniref:glycosyltransferase family 4 protein n=1 Tax=Pseudomonas sp. RIT-PI-S TaxID=3035295 RepID=UPI0021DA3286|nr:glycosyltransferase family 4 protein [Pseudomonas sp. RIT-PI-S]
MRILVLSFYYAPDLSAGSFRTTALVEALQRMLPAKASIDVITTAPNRYREFNQSAETMEINGIVRITRISLPAHSSGMLDQSRAFMVFAQAAYQHAIKGKYDVVYATSSRLMTAVLGACVAKRLKIPLYLDVRDIFVDTMEDIFSSSLVRGIIPILSRLERFCIRTASIVNVVSPGFLSYFQEKYPGIHLSCYTNGIDEIFIDTVPTQRQKKTPSVYNVTYAGNIGEGQGLHLIVPALAKKLGNRIRFRIVGAGGRLEQLHQAIKHEGCSNVEIEAPVERARLLELYQEADVLFLHLNDYKAFEKVLPSKVFEYAATGKPVWAGVSGYAAMFIEENLENTAVFSPCDTIGALKAFERLDFVDTSRESFVKCYKRDAIMAKLAGDLISLGHAGTQKT